jgi:hypothetical protein
MSAYIEADLHMDKHSLVIIPLIEVRFAVLNATFYLWYARILAAAIRMIKISHWLKCPWLIDSGPD